MRAEAFEEISDGVSKALGLENAYEIREQKVEETDLWGFKRGAFWVVVGLFAFCFLVAI